MKRILKFDYFDYFILGHTHNACFCNCEMTDFDFNEAYIQSEKSCYRGKRKKAKNVVKEKSQKYYDFNIGIINSGGWLDYKCDLETLRNYIVIDEDQIMLCSADMDEPIKREILNKE